MARVYTEVQCPLYGSDYCARLNMESCEKCTVKKRDEADIEALKSDLDAVEALMPEGGISDLFLTDTCVLCKDEPKGERSCYALTDLGNAEPRMKKTYLFGIKHEARAGSVLPLQIACCDDCRKRYRLLQNGPTCLSVGIMTAAFALLSIRSLREPILAIAQWLPFAVFAAVTLIGIAAGRIWRKSMIRKYGKVMYLSVFRIETLRQMRKLGWFELYEAKDFSRLLFSKNRIRRGLYTGDPAGATWAAEAAAEPAEQDEPAQTPVE